jgi:hypothetical protein
MWNLLRSNFGRLVNELLRRLHALGKEPALNTF